MKMYIIQPYFEEIKGIRVEEKVKDLSASIIHEETGKLLFDLDVHETFAVLHIGNTDITFAMINDDTPLTEIKSLCTLIQHYATSFNIK